MSQYASISYNRRTPWAQVQRILHEAPLPAPTPPPPSVYYLVSGTLTENGSIPSFSAGIEFSSLGTYFTAASGSYGLLVAQGYSGLAIPHYPLGDFTPQTRTYVSVGTDIPDQDYDYVPYPPQPDLLITGQVRRDGIAVSGAQVALSGSAAAFSAGSGTYVGTVAYGYSGTGALQGYGLPNYAVTPSARVYTGLASSQAGQDYDVATQIWLISGTVTSDGTGVSTEIGNGTSLWNTSASGSYGFNVIGGWSGATATSWISPDAYNYVSVTSSIPNQNFDLPVPPLTYTYPDLDWSGWGYAIPDYWQVQIQSGTTWSDYDVAAGAATDYTVTVFGSYYRIYGRDPSNQQITPFSNDVLATPPDPPTFTIAGALTDSGTAMVGVGVEFTSTGTAITDSFGTYSQIVFGGYSGTAIPHYGGGTFSPDLRVYTAVSADYYNEDYAFYGTTPPLPTYLISGTVTPGFVTGIEFTGIGTIFTAASGSYGQQVVQGYSGTATPHATPDVFAPVQRFYGSVGADTPNQDYTYTLPFFAVVGEIRLDGVPTEGISVTFTGDGQGTSDVSGTYAGNLVYGYNGTASVLGYTGTGYIITPSVRVYTGLTGPLAGQDYDIASQFFTISGSLTDGASPMAGIGVELTAHGTVITDGTGVYSQIVSTGYSGTGIPHYSGGTFDPSLRVYTNVLSEQPQQDYVFYGTGTVAPTDCPVVSTLAVIPIDVTPKNPSRNVIDPVNNLLWVIDEYYPNVYYLDVVAGTYAGSVSTAASGGSPCIAYDAVNQKVVVTTYDGSLAFIDPVSKAVTFSNFVQQWPNYHMLAVDQYGTVYVCDNRNNVTGSLYVVDGNTEQLLASYHLGMHGVSSDSICWAENINRLVLNSNGFGLTRFYLFDTTTGNFSASVLTNGSWTFSYENYYVKGTGNVLMSQDGATAVQIIDIAQGTDATVLGSLAADINDGAPTRAADVTEDTCANTLFVSDGNYGVWEYTMDGSYTLLNVFDNGYLGLNPTGLSHSRATNQVYYENYVDGTTYSVPYAQYPISGFVHEAGTGIAFAAVEFTTFGTQTADANGTYSLIVPVEWSGTVTPHLAAGTFVPLDRVYTSVAAAQPNQDFEYFWGGYLFLTLGTSDFFFSSLAADAVVVNGTIVQLNNDGYVYTSTQGRTGWSLVGFPSIGGRIAYSDSLQRYIVVGAGGAVWEAEDLSVWYSRTSGVEPNALTGVAAGGNRFVAVGVDGNAAMSTDGTNWTATFAGSQQLTDVYYDGAQFVATGVANVVYTTADGTAWTLRPTSPQNTWKAGAYSPELGLHVIIGINGATTAGAIATSTDGTNWTDITGAIPTAETLNGIAWGSNRFVVTDSTGVLWTSSNGTAWDYVTEDPYGKIGRRVEYWKNDWFVICEEEPGS